MMGRCADLAVLTGPVLRCHTEALERSEKAGEEGDVDASLSLTQQAEAYKRQAESLRRTLTMPERTMEVCEICGVFINSTDNEQRRLVRGA